MVCEVAQPRKIYRRRDPEASPFFKLVSSHFDEFERVYPEKFQKQYGFWRPQIRTSIDKFLKCGDLKEGFARVKCDDCGEEMFVAFSCRQRSCCPSCGEKRALLLGHRLTTEVLAPVPHRQWVFTIPKRLRIYFRYDRRLLGKLCRAAFEVVRDVFADEVGDNTDSHSTHEMITPGLIAAIQTFGDLINWHSHIHAVVTEGGFTENGVFVRVRDINKADCLARWQDKVFDLLRREEKITQKVEEDMRKWTHSGFSIDYSLRIEPGDDKGIQRLIEYISRSPFSLTRIIGLNPDGKVIYRAGKSECQTYPEVGHEELKAGIPRNFQVFAPLDFLAEVTQHIPNKGEHQIRHYGWYSNKNRGWREKKGLPPNNAGKEPRLDIRLRKRLCWAALIKMVYEVNPLSCPKCGGRMRIVSFIEQDEVIRRILTHCGLWKDPPVRPPPMPVTSRISSPPITEETIDEIPDYSFFSDIYYED